MHCNFKFDIYVSIVITVFSILIQSSACWIMGVNEKFSKFFNYLDFKKYSY